MDNIPANTRDVNRSFHRENLNFPSTLPTVSNNPYSNVVPNYDRNMFSMGGGYEQERRVENDRLDMNIFGNQQHNHFMMPILNQQPISVNKMGGTTRERRDEKRNLDESYNMDRFFLTNRDYGRETMDRINGFSIIPKDTRYDGQKRMEQNQPEMRGNRTTGIPFEKMN